MADGLPLYCAAPSTRMMSACSRSSARATCQIRRAVPPITSTTISSVPNTARRSQWILSFPIRIIFAPEIARQYFLREFARPRDRVDRALLSQPTARPVEGRPAAPIAERKGALCSHLGCRGLTQEVSEPAVLLGDPDRLGAGAGAGL